MDKTENYKKCPTNLPKKEQKIARLSSTEVKDAVKPDFYNGKPKTKGVEPLVEFENHKRR